MVRNYLYNKGHFRATKFAHPVISIGNLSVGGTGKTPHIEYLIELLQSRFHIATLSRGYGRKTSGLKYADATSTSLSIGDEPMMFHRKYPAVKVVVSENRLIAIPDILHQEFPNDAILLDDAFQHRAVKPGLSLLLTDYNRPFYNDYIIPAGMLREPKSEYKRADIIIVTKCPEEMDILERASIIEKIKPYSYQHVYFSYFSYGAIYGLFIREFRPIQSLKNTSIMLFTAIANDAPIIQYLKEKVKAVYPLKFNDHHYFDRFDIETAYSTFQNIEGPDKLILTTEKDATRLALLQAEINAKQLPIFILPIKVQFWGDDKNNFDQDIFQYIETTIRKNKS
jgi:tetraacyldisaccharide 4'-kinase